MKNWSIVTKLVASTSGIVCFLVLLGGYILIRFEVKMVDTFTQEILRGYHELINDREMDEKRSLKQSINFSTHILNGIGAAYLYNLDQEGLKQSLRPFMNYDGIVAIKVLDEQGKPFAAAWRNPGVEIGNEIPKDLELNDALSTQAESFRGDKKIGVFKIYYSDKLLQQRIQELKKEASLDVTKFEASSRAQLENAILSQSIGVVLILLVLAVTLIFFLRALVLKPLKNVSRIARKLSQFDLAVTIDTKRKDEIGVLLGAINEMAASFRMVLGQVQRSGIQVTSSSTELAATAREQEATMGNQLTSSKKVVASVKEISGLSNELVKTMDQVAAMSQETAGFAATGQSDLGRMEEAMRNMESASKSISGRLETINEKAENITTVVVTITKVADQTNLLSLNAAIEAEKAGEYGRGFNVVAREIRRLADQTAVATLDIEQMVQEMQTAVSAGVMEMDKFIGEVKRSAEDVGRISNQLAKIIEQVQALSPSFENVNVSMAQQSRNATEINTAIVNLSEEMQQTMESLHESYSAIEQLNEAARGLQDEVGRFKVG